MFLFRNNQQCQKQQIIQQYQFLQNIQINKDQIEDSFRSKVCQLFYNQNYGVVKSSIIHFQRLKYLFRLSYYSNQSLQMQKKKTINMYSVGKQLRKAKGLRKEDPTAQIIEPPPQLQQYIHYLQKRGVTINDLSVARFKTKNGLPYTGLITNNLFPTNKVFIRVPVDCLLNTKVGFHSDIKDMLVEHPEYFCKQFHSNWEDHILLAYILYEYGKGEESQWYHLIRNLPREIDYVIFWQEQEIRLLEDKTIEKMIKKQRGIYQKQTSEFIVIAKQYPQFYSKQILTEENIRWIHIHLVTRCFGKYFEYTTMVPFAQLINHQCSDVYYTMFYKEGNPNTTNQVFYEQKVLTEEEINDLRTSDGTYNSSEFDDLDDLFEFEDFELIPENLKSKNNQQVVKLGQDVYSLLFKSVNFGDNASLGFLLETYEAVNYVLNSDDQTVNYKKVELTRMMSHITYYSSKIKSKQALCKFTKAYHTETEYYQKETNAEDSKQEESSKPEHGVDYFQKEWPEQPFDQFLMLCSSKDQFQKHSQIFFCYGRLSNRMMLMRYGMTLEHNKYNHIYLHLNSEDYFENYTIYPKLVKKYKLPKTKTIKVRRTKLCVELLTFLRALEWKFNERIADIFVVKNFKTELRVIKKALSIFKEQLGKFSLEYEILEKMLYDSKIGYHEYFSVIYKLEKQRIIKSQIELLSVAYEIIMRLLDGKTVLEQAMLIVPEFESAFQMRTNRLMMKEYFDKCFKE